MTYLQTHLLIGLLVIGQTAAITRSELQHQGIKGAVKLIAEDIVNLSSKSGNWIEGARTKAYVAQFDTKGNLTRLDDFSRSPMLIKKITFKYAALRRTDTIEYTNKLGTLGPFIAEVIERVYRVNPEGLRIEENAHRRGRGLRSPMPLLIDSRVYSYDSKGNRVGIISSVPGESYREQYRIDCENNVTEMERFSSTDQLLLRESYEYGFDDKGNWVRRLTIRKQFTDGKPSLETREALYRTITYY